MKIDLSLTEENYLKSIYHLGESGNTEVSTNAIAESMSTKPATVSDMIKRLSRKKVITHEKYRGVHLTDSGCQLALQIIRKHRLWEVFLVEKLHFNWDEVHEIAEQLEHIKSPLLVERLDAFLGHPKVDPHGDPIPDQHGDFHVGPTLLLSELAVGDSGILVGVSDTDARLLQYMDKINLGLGMKVKLNERIEFDGSLELKTEHNPSLFLSETIAKQLTIRKLS